MDEYIERSAAVKAVLRERSPANSVAQNRKLSIIQRDLLTMPAADVVVVTRCKDCRNHRELNRKDRLESGYAEGVLWCMNRSDGVWADGFCSDGEPKEV